MIGGGECAKLSGAPVIYIQRAWYGEGPEIVRGEETTRKVNVGRTFPAKGDSITNEIPPGPLKTEKGANVGGEKYVIIMRLIVTYRLIRIRINIARESREGIELEGSVLNP